ncbi:NAD-dependent epimerase/dehydratase family protein [Ectopseudomonas khazarica]|uniref:NAD-dependent epimerase/dehydratase family protein n=1 Tax=Ectopseudomonas khazarica TaxID=2502979 RepID=UPI0037C55306
MNICVTGASGFVGRHLCRALLDLGHNVRGLSRKAAGLISGVDSYAGDLSDPALELSSFLDGVDVVFHCAGEIKDTSKMFALHVEGTSALLRQVRVEHLKNSKPIHWVQLSSVGAYGLTVVPANKPKLISPESSELPEGVYEVTKTASDSLVRSFSLVEDFFTYSILRPTAIIGVDMPNESIFKLFEAIRRGLFFYIDGRKAIANYVHVDDVVHALVVCGFDQRARNKVSLIADDCSLEELVNVVADFYGVTRPRLCLPYWLVRIAALCSVPGFPLTRNRVDVMVRRINYQSSFSCQDDGVAGVGISEKILLLLTERNSVKR